MKSITKKRKEWFSFCKGLIKWLIIAVLMGAVGGIIGSLFHICIDYATEYRTEHPWMIYFLPFSGLCIAFFYHLANSQGKLDTDRVLESVQTGNKVPAVMAPLIFFSTILTHLTGGSAGREGAALQLGGSIGYQIGRMFRLTERENRLMVMTGMSAVFSALFGTPLTALFFSLEVSSVGMMNYTYFIPCAVASLTASFTAKQFGLSPVSFSNIAEPAVTLGTVGKVCILAILCAWVSILFCESIHQCEKYAKKWIPNAYLRSIVGGCLLIFMTLAVQTGDYNGAGMDIVSKAMNGQAKPEAFLLKIMFTAITMAAGLKGGEIVPSFFVGSVFGCTAGRLLGLDPGFSATVGCTALFCGAVNCPIASLFLALELFGGQSMILFALVCGISYMFSGNGGLYRNQKLVFLKMMSEK